MHFELTDEQRAIRDLVRDFTEKEVTPNAARWDEHHEFPYEAVARMGELGLFGLPYPEEYGGGGADFLSYCIALEEIARGDAGLSITLEAGVSLGAGPIFWYGSERQKRDLLPDLLTGRRLWAFGLTEPGAGSDAGSTRTRATLAGGTWTINGSKQFITNSGTRISSGVTITAVTGGDAERPEISAIIVPQGTPGYTVEKAYRKLGWHSSDTHPLTFDDCQVPEENLLGPRGAGYRQFLRTLASGRVAIAALSVGLAQACLDASLRYARERQAFGTNIGRFQAIQFKLADMATEIELARLVTYKGAWLMQRDEPGVSPEASNVASMAKVYASEACKRAADQAVQIHGGYGFIEEYPVARYWRDVKINEIGEGTSEVQRMLIARHLGL
ncbi:MAG: acyl-CoA dehydrogenase family protein [Candidatus Dormibacteria bacterium]